MGGPGMASAPLLDTVELLRRLIQNQCVNDGSVDSGQEVRNADLLEGFLGGVGLQFRRFEPAPGRVSLLARLQGSDPSAPTLLLVGHTDVVPATASDWRHDPFGGEIIDGEIWGRGALDMLSSTATMAAAIRELARRPRPSVGDVLFLAEADEESAGTWGAKWIAEHEPEALRADYALTEAAGYRLPLPTRDGAIPIQVAIGERGLHWCRLTIRGRGGHGSEIVGARNATVIAAEVVRRLMAGQPPAVLGDAWHAFVAALDPPPELASAWLDPDRVTGQLAALGAPMSTALHIITHTTIMPTTLRSGTKVNVVPDRAELELDIRTLPGHGSEEVRGFIHDALGDLADAVELAFLVEDPASTSPVSSPLFEAVGRTIERLVPGSRPVPSLFLGGATDARFLRRLGVTAYGAGLFSDRIPLGDMFRMVHGVDERIDTDSLGLLTAFWAGVADALPWLPFRPRG